MAGEDEAAAERSWVPMRVSTLRNILLELDTSLKQRWCEFQWERRWEAAAAAGADPDDAAQRQDLTRRLLDVSSLSWYAFACMLRRVEDDLNEARPRPDSAYWWLWCHSGGNNYRFVLLSQGQAARARELRTDAYARTQCARAAAMEIDRLCLQGPAAEENSVPRLAERLRRLQHLKDAVLVPMRDLKRLVEHLIGDDDGAEAREGRRRGRGRSAPPPRRRMQGAFRCL